MIREACVAMIFWVCGVFSALAEPLARDVLQPYIIPPMSLGEQLNDEGVWQLLNSGGAEAGYVFETEPMAPLPGFSGAAINMLVVLDLEGRFLDVQLISHNEPIFVSGLPEKLFFDFFKQHRGHSISDSLVVGSPYGSGADRSSLVYLDGVTKGTASVRIAHESILAATLKVAREKMNGISTGPPAFPNLDYSEDLTWDDLVDQGIAARKIITNCEIEAEFDGTLWEDDDPEATENPDALPYLDLWVIDTGRHGLVTEEFVRNTAPDLISAEQGGFPIAFRDSDIYIELNDDVPDALHDAVDFGAALILRTDRRLGFDPTAEWILRIKAFREHGSFQPELGRANPRHARAVLRPGRARQTDAAVGGCIAQPAS